MGRLELKDLQRPMTGERVSLDPVEAIPIEEDLPTSPIAGAELIPLGANIDDILPPAIPIPPTLRLFVGTEDSPAPQINSRAELLCILTQHLPQNEYHLPIIIYRPDLLDHNLFNNLQPEQFTTVLQFLKAAELQVVYHEGFPALPDGNPLWGRLPWESIEDYELFQRYLQLPGGRQLSLLSGVPGERVSELFHTNYWGVRVRSNDAFAIAHYARLREQRIVQTNDKHFLEGAKLVEKLAALTMDVNWELLKDEPDKFVKTLAQAMELQRRALELSTQGGKRDEPTAGKPFEFVMRQVTTQPRVDGGPVIDGTPQEQADAREMDLRSILKSAGDIASLQEVVLRVSSSK